MFSEKNRNFLKQVNQRKYFNSLFLVSLNSSFKYDCALTLYLISYNIHFNFKSEVNIYDYFHECSQIQMKFSTSEYFIDNKIIYVFTDFIFNLFILIILFIIGISGCLLVFPKMIFSFKIQS